MAPVCLREMTAAEHAAVQKLAHSRTAPAQMVQRAHIIWRASCRESASAIASGQVSTAKGLVLHAVDAVGLVHAMLLRIQALVLPIQTLVLGGH
jgi:hypothetical protein